MTVQEEKKKSSFTKRKSDAATGQQKGHFPAKRTKQPAEEQTFKSHKEQKALKKERKLARPGADILEQAKGFWEDCRRTDLSDDDRKGPLDNLFESLKGHYKEVLMKNDGSRMVQTLIKYGSKSQKVAIVEELQGHFVDLAKNAYGHFIVEKLLKALPSFRPQIINEFSGKLSSCMKHKTASDIIDTIYSDYSKLAQRNEMMHEFYGKEFLLFKEQYRGLGLWEILQKHPDKREPVLKRLRESIDGVLKKEATNLIHHSILHRMILDYAKCEEVKTVRSWIPNILDALMEIVHTEDGAKAAVLFIAMAGAKERKAIVKACRQYLAKLIKDEYGHLVVIALMSFVDDTVLLEKSVVQELKQHEVNELFDNRYSRQVLFALYTPVDGRYFVKDTVELFALAQKIALETSKKPEELRRRELAAHMTPLLYAHFSKRLPEGLKAPMIGSLIMEMTGSGLSEDFFNDLKRVLSRESDTLLCDPAYRSFFKKLFKRMSSEERLIELAGAVNMERLFESEAAFVLAPLLTRPTCRSFVMDTIAKLKKMTEHAKSLADMANRASAGLSLYTADRS